MKVTLTSEEIKTAIAEYIEREFGVDSYCVEFSEAYVQNTHIANNAFSMLESIRDIEIKAKDIPEQSITVIKRDEPLVYENRRYPHDSKEWDFN